MYNADYQHVVYELGFGKCGWSLQTHILLNTNVEYLNNTFGFPNCKSVEWFYKYYNYRHLTPDVWLYNNINQCLALAVQYNNMKMVSDIIKQDIADYFCPMYEAALHGHIEIVKLLLEKGFNDYHFVMRGAAWGGHLKIITMMFEYGVNDYRDIIDCAEEGGHYDIVNWLTEKMKT